MNVSTELIFSLIIQLVAIGVVLGTYKQTISFMQQQIVELKDDMRKYNSVLERMIINEQNIKAIWHKLDEYKND